MSNYGVFAQYYDKLLSNGEYEVRSDYISGFIIDNGINSGKMLDIACGTGEFTKYFVNKGFDVTGLDLSEDMLSIAKSKCPDTLFLRCDMREFDFKGEFDCCICCFDSINHLNFAEDWKKCFDSVARSVKSGGMFIFDVNTEYKHNCVLSGNSFIFDEEDCFLAWDNYGEGDGNVDIFLDFFIYNGKNYDRYSENFSETAFKSDFIVNMLKDNFQILGIYNDLTKEPENEESVRLYFICKRK